MNSAIPLTLPADRTWPQALGRVLTLPRTWLAIGMAWALIYTWASRDNMNPDGMSYIDLALNAAKHGPGQLINGYWSPAYPALLAVVFWLVRPSAAALYPLAHLVNFLIFVAVFQAFGFFLRQWLRGISDDRPQWTAFGYAIFLWHTLELIGVAQICPDLGIAGVGFLAAGLVWKVSSEDRPWTTYAVLGAALGAGYWIKAALLPIGLLGLALLWLLPPGAFLNRRKMVWAALAFIATCAPLIALESAHARRLTTGDTGPLNYVWCVNLFQRHLGWTEAGVNGTPVHPPRKLQESPLVLEFAEPVRGTFPLWYEPSYWYEGIKIRFHLDRQLAALATNGRAYAEMFQYMNGLIAGALLLVVFLLRDRKKPPNLLTWQTAWAVAVLLLYAAVYTEPRYVAGFCVLLWMDLYRRMLPAAQPAHRRIILCAVAATMAIPSLIMASTVARFTLPELAGAPPSDSLAIARALEAHGLRPGDRLAVVGDGFDSYFAQLGGFRLAAEVPDAQSFRNLDQAHQRQIAESLQQVGIKALVSREQPSAALPGWERVAGVYALFPR